MLCRSCKKNVESSMRHAITANSCPFCGNSIFDSSEFALRKSIARVLIKNGLENEDNINKIVDDLMALTSGGERIEEEIAAPASAEPARQLAPVSAKPLDPEAARERARALAAQRAAGLNDGLTAAERDAPTRILSPAPRPTAQMVPAGVDPIANAMKEFESANNLEAKFAREDAAPVATDDDTDLAGVFFMERTEAAEKADRLRSIANSPRPSFKK